MSVNTGALLPVSLPAEFQDLLQAEFLKAPDADYTWARFFYSAVLAYEKRLLQEILQRRCLCLILSFI